MDTATSDPPTGFPGLLKTWRSRRRLSQLELSLEAGLSQRHISFLETGRSRPSRFSIAQLGEALGMPPAEIDAMLVSAGFAGRAAAAGWAEDTRAAVDAAIVHVLDGHAPFPAVLVDRIWTIIRANAPALRFFAEMGAGDDRNVIRSLLTPGPLRERILNWDAVARALFRLLALEVARRPTDRDAHALLAELTALPGVAAAVETPPTHDPAPVLTIRFDMGGAAADFFSLIATVGMSADPRLDDLRIETLLPADPRSRELYLARFGGAADGG